MNTSEFFDLTIDIPARIHYTVPHEVVKDSGELDQIDVLIAGAREGEVGNGSGRLRREPNRSPSLIAASCRTCPAWEYRCDRLLVDYSVDARGYGEV
jgi:hypothetical protein